MESSAELLHCETLALDRLTLALNAALLEAARKTCPEHLSVWTLPKERVRRCQSARDGPDLFCHAPATVWHRLRAHASKANCRQSQSRKLQSGDSCGGSGGGGGSCGGSRCGLSGGGGSGNGGSRGGRSGDGAHSGGGGGGNVDAIGGDVSCAIAEIAIETTSEFGVRRRAVYTSAESFSRSILSALDETSARLLADARPRSDGALWLTSTLHMRRQRAQGMLHCADCGLFFGGRRGKSRTAPCSTHPCATNASLPV